MTHLKRLLVAVFFIILIEFMSLLWVPPGWVALISGAIGSLILIFPPMRLEIWKAIRSRFREQRMIDRVLSADLRELDQQIDQRYTKKIEEHDEFDPFFLITGGVFLAFYFLFQIPYKMEVVNRDELLQQIDKLRIEQLDRMRQIQQRR